MYDIYLRTRNNPLSLTTESSSVSDIRLTFNGLATYPTCAMTNSGLIIVCYEENNVIYSLYTADWGVTISSVSTLVTSASCPFIVRDPTSDIIHMIYWDNTTALITYNYSTDNLSTLNLASPSVVYGSVVGEQQPTLIVYPSGQLIATFIRTTGNPLVYSIVSYYSDDYGKTTPWTAVS